MARVLGVFVLLIVMGLGLLGGLTLLFELSDQIEESGMLAQNPQPVDQHIIRDGPRTDDPPGTRLIHKVPKEPEDSSLTLSDGQHFGSPGRSVISLGADEAAVIQAYEIEGRVMCQVAGVVGPADVSVMDGEGWIFRGVNVSASDLESAMNQAAQVQQSDPVAHCGTSNRFVID